MESKLITLGKRDNTVFILTPLYLVLFYFFRDFYMGFGGSLILMILYMICWVVAVVSVLRFFRRIFLPSKIIEYDVAHVYINRGLKGTQMIPWTDIRSVDNLQNKGGIDSFIDAIRKPFKYQRHLGLFEAAWELSTTGIIVLNCKGELVRVHGIKNAREVRNELHKIIISKRRELENTLGLR